MDDAPGDSDATRSQPPTLKGQPHFAAHSQPIERGETFVDEAETYAIENQIGAGGMGTVLAARGSRFGRSVALKVVTADREDLRRRFEREAQVTARLQHPAIVPVYGSGRGRNGQPFYAMKQVTGQPLDQAIAKTTTHATRIALLPNVIAVTEAIAYAHAQRVIHRDLKPANILVGAFGETVVIDWGLAKDLARGEDEPESPYRATDSGAGADATAIGKVMGTPAYMPLEQARGEVVDERADVYALGAILYHLLHGASPYLREGERGVPWETMVARVLADPPPALASLEPDVPADLLAIVARAMAREARDRYPSAGELAEDLRRFQTGQLVGAHRYSTWQLVKRWLRRHRTAVTVAAAAVVVLAVVSAIGIQRIRRERTEAEEARAVAEEQRGLAVASRNEAEDLMGFMLGDLKDKLQPVGKLEILDAVAKKSMAYYQRQPDTGTDPERRKRAQAFISVGEVLQAQGNLDGALVAFRDALAIREALARKPNSWADHADVAAARWKIGDAIFYRGDGKAALAEYRAGMPMAEAAAAAEPANPQFQHQVSVGHDDIGDVLIEQGDLAGALAAFEASMAIRKRLVAAEPTNQRWLRNLYISHNKVATGQLATGKLELALANFRTCKELVDKLAALDPTNAVFERDRTTAAARVGDVLVQLGKGAEALVEYRAAMAIVDKLLARDATNTLWLRDAVVSHQNLGVALAAANDRPAALAEYRAALAASEQLVKLDPTNGQWRRDLMIIHQKIGTFLRIAGDVTAALAEDRISLAMIEALIKADPANLLYKSDLASNHNMTGNVLGNLPDPAKQRLAIPEFEASSRIFGELAASVPDNVRYQRGYAMSLTNLGDTYAGLLDDKAIEPYRKALTVFALLRTLEPANHATETNEAMIHLNLGELAQHSKQLAVTRSEYQTASTILDAVLLIDGKNAQWLALQAEVKKRLAACCK
ncbi:MAG: serine/threonine-protein kinase [Kofleriaceae bacterium]